ncbi:hypothetical protein N7499_007028 [Penicillium canescens]|nr:hypothetical protein N7499_007028 [Penicillium canescens]KAJ6176049.1 hypothetical protein N7485_002963 [Penicillium canescens]
MWLLIGILTLGVLYMWRINCAMKAVPDEARQLSPNRWTVEEIKAAYKKNLETPIDMTKHLPPKQSRRYVIVGGTGLVGAWITNHLLARGEDPKTVRVLDLARPAQELLDHGVGYTKVNITDELAVETAFEEPWPATAANLPLTVYHTAAVIRPSDRLQSMLSLCSKVNIDGTRNVLSAAKKAGASCFIWTSSGSIGIHRPKFWIMPWATEPKRVVQVLNDEAKLPQTHEEFFGNYAVSKAEAERIVRTADDPENNFRTGCIRPVNGIYGTGSENNMAITDIYLRNGGSPTWASPVLQSFVHAENVSLAHLLYEQRLIEQSNPSNPNPKTSGQAYVVTDPNPAIAFGDLYKLLSTLSKTPVSFPALQPAPFLLLSYIVEAYAFLRYNYLHSLIPAIPKDLEQIQPALFGILNIHVFGDDRRARLSPEAGGLGYAPVISTLDGMCRRLVDWNMLAESEGVRVKGVVQRLGIEVEREGVDVNGVAPMKV